MKRQIFLIVMLFGFMFQSKANVVSTLIDSTKQMVTEFKDSTVKTIKEIDTSSTFRLMYTDFKQGVIALGSVLKVGAEHVYGVLVRQQIVYGIIYLLFLICGVLLTYNWIKKYKDKNEDWTNGQDPTGLGIVRTIQIIIAFIFIFIGTFNIDKTITGFVNPEYGAIEEVIKMVEKVKK